MKKTPSKKKPISAIARMAERGEDISRFFPGNGKMVRPESRPQPEKK